MTAIDRERIAAGLAIAGAGIWHAFTVSPLAPESAFGYALGYLSLFLTLVSVIAIYQHRAWGRHLLGLVGGGIVVGFFVTHLLPIHSYWTDPYVGVKGLTVKQWAPVIASMILGAWALVAALRTNGAYTTVASESVGVEAMADRTRD